MNKKRSKFQECVLTGILTLTACLIIYQLNILNPNILLFVILSAVLVKCGYAAGMVCGVITFLYSAFFFSIDHSLVQFTPENFNKLGIIGIGIVANIVLIGQLQYRAEQAIVENAELEKKYLENIAYTDGLTKLANRYAYEQERNRLEELKEIPVVIMVSDMNGLKEINDTLGHHVGDEAICKIAELLENAFQKEAKCYRIGGDEFCVLSESLSVEGFEERRLAFIRAVENSEGYIDGYGVATGVATGKSADMDKIFREADHRMYSCKKEMKEKLNVR